MTINIESFVVQHLTISFYQRQYSTLEFYSQAVFTVSSLQVFLFIFEEVIQHTVCWKTSWIDSDLYYSTMILVEILVQLETGQMSFHAFAYMLKNAGYNFHFLIWYTSLLKWLIITQDCHRNHSNYFPVTKYNRYQNRVKCGNDQNTTKPKWTHHFK